MGIVEAVKKGFGSAGKLINVMAVFFIFNVTIGLISLPLADPAKAANPGMIGVSIIASILFFLLFIFLQGGAMGLVKDQIKTVAADMSRFVVYGKQYYGRILGLLLMYVVIAIGVVLVLSLISAGLLLLGDNLVTRSIVAIIVTAAAVGTITLLVYPIYVVVSEDMGAVEALKKGVATAKANFWTTLGLFVVMLLISLAISLVIGFVVGIVSMPLPVKITQVLMAVINAVVQSYIPIVMMVAFMNFYLSLTAGTSSQAVQDSPSSQAGE